ncbi:hypothetical protein ACFQ0B_74730 [Nonomuraea thailandensis]
MTSAPCSSSSRCLSSSVATHAETRTRLASSSAPTEMISAPCLPSSSSRSRWTARSSASVRSAPLRHSAPPHTSRIQLSRAARSPVKRRLST